MPEGRQRDKTLRVKGLCDKHKCRLLRLRRRKKRVILNVSNIVMPVTGFFPTQTQQKLKKKKKSKNNTDPLLCGVELP